MNRINLASTYFPNPLADKALVGAEIYVGTVDLDPEVVINRKQISVLQENGSYVNVSQPITTGAGGVPVYNGAPVSLHVDGAYSLKIKTATGEQAYYIPKNETSNFKDFVQTISDLEGIGFTPETGRVFDVLGLAAPGDGGGGEFYWVSDSTETPITGMIVQVAGVATGRFKRDYSGFVNVLWLGASTDYTVDSTTALKEAHDNYLKVFYPPGNFSISDKIDIRPLSHIIGSGPCEYIYSYAEGYTGLYDKTIRGTRIIQTSANPVFNTVYVSDEFRLSYITIKDMSLLGGGPGSIGITGTYGIYNSKSFFMTLENVWAQFFANHGIYTVGSLGVSITRCLVKYCADSGIFLDYGSAGAGEELNAYMSIIKDCIIHQNKHNGIKLGVSTVRVDIIDCDIESQGSYFPTGDGIGVYVALSSNTVNIRGCWVEGNKIGIVVGDNVNAVPSVNTIPFNTAIQNCEFWSTQSGVNLKFNAGRNHIVDNCRFFGSQTISVGPFSDNPLITNCSGAHVVKDSNNNVVSINKGFTNQFPYSALDHAGYFTTANCTLAKDLAAVSPAGKLPVYKITPSSAAQCQIQSVTTPMPFTLKRGTLGFFIKTDSTARPTIWPLMSSATQYTSSANDIYFIEREWTWVAIGRHTPSADNGNKTMTFTIESTDVQPIYISGLVWLDGIVYDPYQLNDDGIATFTNSFTPSVYGLRTVKTEGAISHSNYLDGVPSQVLTILFRHNVTVEHNIAKISLNGAANFNGVPGNTLTLVLGEDNVWYEKARKV